MKKLFLLLSVLWANALSAQILDTLLKKHLQAIGGVNACANLAPYQAQYVYESVGDKTELEVFRGQGKQIRVNKKYFYRDQPIQAGKLFFDLVNEQGAWSFRPDQEDTLPHAVSNYEAEFILSSYDWLDPLVEYTKKKMRIDYLSTEYFNETFYHKLLVFYPNGKQEYIFLHPETFLIDRRIINDPSIDDDKSINSYMKVNNTCLLPKEIQINGSTLTLKSLKPIKVPNSAWFSAPKRFK